jgi:hypothetical protein
MYKYVIHPGNNSRLLIKPILDQRGNWIEASEHESSEFKAQFIWRPVVFPSRVKLIRLTTKWKSFSAKASA